MPGQPAIESKEDDVSKEAKETGSFTVPKVIYTPEELKYRGELITKLVNARDQRDRPHPELDGMTYIEYYESNRRKDLSYLPPKQNKQDVRIVTGTTREKDTSLLNALLNMNLEPDITAFDHDDMVVNELGDNMSDMVKKSREIEEWMRKRALIYRELISQGDVFVQELHVEEFRKMPVGDVKWDPTSATVEEFKTTERLQKLFERCESRMVNGKKVYLFNIRQPHIEEQPGVAVLNIYPRAIAEARYSKWERWKNVPYTVDTINAFFDDGATYKDWNLVTLNDRDKVAEIMIYLPQENRFQIMLNGVLMCPMSYPLSAISPTGEIPMAQGKLEPISDFAYSKSQPSKAKIDQEVMDEVLKLMVEKTRQSFRPPLGSRGKKVFSPAIFMAGKITNEIQEGELFPLLGDKFAAGVTTPEFSFYKLVKENIDEKTTSQNFDGQDTPGDTTAYEISTMRQQQMLQLGLSLDGVINLERRMSWNRIYNILTYWTKEVDDHVDDVKKGIYDGYRTFSMNTTVDGGENGIKVFRMSTKQYPDVNDHHQEEEDMSKKYGKPVRITYLNPKMLRTVKYKWFILINPTPKSNDTLSQLLFVQNLRTAMELFGPDALNGDYVKQRFAILINEDYSKFFKKMSIQDMLNQGPNSPMTQNALGKSGTGINVADQNGGGNAPPKNIGPKKAAGKKPMQAAIM